MTLGDALEMTQPVGEKGLRYAVGTDPQGNAYSACVGPGYPLEIMRVDVSRAAGEWPTFGVALNPSRTMAVDWQPQNPAEMPQDGEQG